MNVCISGGEIEGVGRKEGDRKKGGYVEMAEGERNDTE